MTPHRDAVTQFANPYLACDDCGGWITGATNLHTDGPSLNVPCRHKAGSTSRCPSWSPVDGCMCLEQLGYRDHAAPTSTEGATA